MFNSGGPGGFHAVSTEERLPNHHSLEPFYISESLIQLQYFSSRPFHLHPPSVILWLSSWSKSTVLLRGSAVSPTHAAFADIHFGTTQSTWVTMQREKCLLSATVNIPLTQSEQGEIYEIHMFNTFHFVPRICTAYHSTLGWKHSV